MARTPPAKATIFAGALAAMLAAHDAWAGPFSCPSPPPDPAGAEKLARSLWDEALTVEPSDPSGALERLRCAQKATDRPAIALRIAVISERLGDDEAALASFERYLTLAGPDAPDAAATKQHIEELRARIREQKQRAETPPQPTPKPPADTGFRGPPLASWIAGGVGLAGLAAFTAFALLAESEDAKLEGCSPNCGDPALLDEEERRDRYATIANVSLAVGAAGIVAAGVIWLVAPRDPPTVAADGRRVRVRFTF
jgi:hypothetical protein